MSMLSARRAIFTGPSHLSADFSSLLLFEAMEFIEDAVFTELVDEPAVKCNTTLLHGSIQQNQKRQ